MDNEKHSLNELCKNLKICKSLKKEFLDNLESNFFSSIFSKYIEASYLSHWKSTIESVILQNRREKNCTKTSHSTNNYSSYKIIIIEKKDLDVPALILTDENLSLDTIHVNAAMNTSEKRVTIAHELGHIIINRCLLENENFNSEDITHLSEEEREELATLFSYYIIEDRSHFYKKISQKHSLFYKDIEKIIKEININYKNSNKLS